jgi:glycosyltransferase involved in cell wall biosynthesis
LKVILNCSTNHIGGAVQVASSLIKKSIKHPYDIQWFYILSRPVAENISVYLNKLAKESYIIINGSPALIIKGFRTRKVIRDFEKKLNPDLILTVFGPSYIKFKSTHLCGFADAWFTNPNKYASSQLNFKEKLVTKLKYFYKGLNLSRKDYYWTETKISQQGLMKKLKINQDKIEVIPNTATNYFWDYYYDKKENFEVNLKDQTSFDVVILFAPYKHKNFSIIPEIAYQLNNLLRKENKECRFHVTFPNSDNKEIIKFWHDVKHYEINDLIINHGYLKSRECLTLFQKSDLLFLPTLIETFSVTYLEAMLTNTLIVTTNIDFAKEICSDAALYYEPLDAQDAVTKIHSLLTKDDITQTQFKNTRNRIGKFINLDQKYDLHVSLIKRIIESKRQ